MLSQQINIHSGLSVHKSSQVLKHLFGYSLLNKNFGKAISCMPLTFIYCWHINVRTLLCREKYDYDAVRSFYCPLFDFLPCKKSNMADLLATKVWVFKK